MDFGHYGFLRLAATAPLVEIGNPQANADAIITSYRKLIGNEISVVTTPELSVTGYTCEDLFTTDQLIADARLALDKIAKATTEAALIVGAPWRLTDGRLVNAAFVCAKGRVLGAVPKSAHPNYDEFYEKRWFASGEHVVIEVNDDVLGRFSLRRDQLFSLASTHIGIEVCEDLWSPTPPSVAHALAGAEIIVNISASNDLVAKADYRRDLVRMQSARLICGYLYASSGPTESTKDVVFGGHLLAAENGHLLKESERFSLDGCDLICEFDYQRLRHERSHNTTFSGSQRKHPYPVVKTEVSIPLRNTQRHYEKHPFVPEDEHTFDSRAVEILAIQATGLARRMRAARIKDLVIGISGGLDSTLACLVCLDSLKLNHLEICIGMLMLLLLLLMGEFLSFLQFHQL